MPGYYKKFNNHESFLICDKFMAILDAFKVTSGQPKDLNYIDTLDIIERHVEIQRRRVEGIQELA
jgi:hypothetical protein